jgi:hypothetical protein
MKKDEDGKPVVKDSSNGLGIRPRDIAPNAEGLVSPGTGGMSVAPRWGDLPVELIPKRLEDKVPGAAGRNSLACFALGEGSFEEGEIAPELRLRPNKPDHGYIEPQTKMKLEKYKDAIIATRNCWTEDEE